ncbi:MAG: hypothetical protein M3P27_07730 [Acidobacteriota bacterium]|nr:hypothetical protein [Acidobacteriota bacterium]
MQRLHRYLVSFLLFAALIVPVGLQAKDHCPAREGKHGYWDSDHKECHYWNDREDHSYKTWQTENKVDRAYARLRAKQQRAYWKWRHEHPDDNDHR